MPTKVGLKKCKAFLQGDTLCFLAENQGILSMVHPEKAAEYADKATRVFGREMKIIIKEGKDISEINTDSAVGADKPIEEVVDIDMLAGLIMEEF